MQTQEQTDISLAPLIDQLHKVYTDLSQSVLRQDGTELPRALFVVKRDSRAWGHITTRPAWHHEYETLDIEDPYLWQGVAMGLSMTTTKREGFHEIMVSGENLARGAREVFGTVAHEVAHAVNIAKGIRDVDSNGRHNKRFQSTAQAFFGLTITEHKTYGWTLTAVSDKCAERWQEQIADIEAGITAVAGDLGLTTGGAGGLGGFFGGGTDTGGRKNKNMTRATCGCGSIIRTSDRALGKGIMCHECGEDFRPSN